MTTIVPQLLTITDLAAEKAAAMLKDKGYEEGSLRVFVVGGGCSGHQYGMALATDKEEGDQEIIHKGVTFLVDPESAPLLVGARVDYIDDVMKQGFSISNPNAAKTCACGTSFDTAEQTGTDQARSCC